MASVLDVPALQMPDASRGIAMLGRGLEQRFANQAEERRRTALSQIGQMVQGGDYSGAAGAAFGQGDLKSGLSIMELEQGDREAAEKKIGRAIEMADTPDKWARVIPTVAKHLGAEGERFVQEFGDFANRDAALAVLGSSEPGDQLAREKFDYEREQDAGEPPDVVEIFDQSSGQPMKATWDQQQRKFVPVGGVKAPTNGVQVITHPDGTTETIVGGSGALGKRAEGDVQLRAINAADMAGRIANTMSGFKPEFLTYGERFKNAFRGVKAKIDPESLAPGDKKSLSDFASWRATAFDNLSTTLKEMSGAAVTPQEFERLKQSLPNPGTGIFDGDDPVSFKAKLDNVMQLTEQALKRYEFYQSQGVPSSLDEIPLGNVQKINGKWYVKQGDKVFEVGQ